MPVELLSAFRNARVFDLSQPYFVGMPHHPNHPPFLFGLTKRHGDLWHPAGDSNGMSSAADSMAMSGHTGTHIDALNHFSLCGKFHNGEAVDEHQNYGGIDSLSADTIPPIVRRGVLLDLAGTEPLAKGTVVGPEDLDRAAGGLEIQAGDIVLIRTGWAAYWNDPRRYICELHGPGPDLEGARWLSARKVFAAGSDTVCFEHVPAPEMPVHVHLLVESGIHIMENLNLEELAAAKIREFVYIAAPLRIQGGTGAPIRPLALVQQAS
jgi:kynurenine formamidase